MRMDGEMVASGLRHEDRVEVFNQLRKSMSQRSVFRRRTAEALNAAKTLSREQRVADLETQIQGIGRAVEEAYQDSNDFSSESYQEISDAIQRLKERSLLNTLADIQEAQVSVPEPDGSILPEEELEVILPLLKSDSSITVPQTFIPITYSDWSKPNNRPG